MFGGRSCSSAGRGADRWTRDDVHEIAGAAGVRTTGMRAGPRTGMRTRMRTMDDICSDLRHLPKRERLTLLNGLAKEHPQVFIAVMAMPQMQMAQNGPDARLAGLPPGPAPKNGRDGKDGTDGKDGAVGARGERGANGLGIRGPPGANAVGIQGPPGRNGVGIQGPPGSNGVGIQGPPGRNGVGIQGPPGANGVGIQGPPGRNAVGIQGPPGRNGAPGRNASMTPAMQQVLMELQEAANDRERNIGGLLDRASILDARFEALEHQLTERTGASAADLARLKRQLQAQWEGFVQEVRQQVEMPFRGTCHRGWHSSTRCASGCTRSMAQRPPSSKLLTSRSLRWRNRYADSARSATPSSPS